MKQAQAGLAIKDFAKVSSKIQRFISGYLKSSGARGLVIGLSGGLDSAVALQLCANAAGQKKILGLALPSSSTPQDDVSDAVNHASSLGVECKVIAIDPLIENYAKLLPEADNKTRGNLVARMRMGILYYFAASRNSLVVGTSDRSELMIGYFTKFGDGSADILPIASLYKTQIRELARYLGVKDTIISKKSSPHLWHGHLAEEEIGISYEEIDIALYCIVDKAMTVERAAEAAVMDKDKIEKIYQLYKKSEHKRIMPPRL